MATPRKSKKKSRGASAARKIAASLAEDQSAATLVIDIGGTKLKILATGETEPRQVPSGPDLTPAEMVTEVRRLAADWDYECISIGLPGQVGDHGPRSEPGNLGAGWVGFDYAAAFERPVRIINDASMQALGSYDGGRMLFLGLGTGLGSALIAENVIVSLELGQLAVDGEDETLGLRLGREGLKRTGKKAWRKAVAEAVHMLTAVFLVDYVVLGGGNAKEFKDPPPGARLGHNLTAFRGGFRLWHLEDVQTFYPNGKPPQSLPTPNEWRVL
jgi:polyphosphate glucokinase